MRILTLLFIGLLTCFNLQAREIVLLAKVKNPTAREMAFSFTVDALLEESKLTVANLNELNEVYFILDFKGQEVVTAEYNGYTFDLFIENENRIEFEFDANDIVNTLQFSGESAANNNVLAAFRKTFEGNGKMQKYSKGYLSTYLAQTDIIKIQSEDLKTYEEGITKVFNQKMAFLQSKTGISPAFKTYLNRKINYGTSTAQLAYYIVKEESITEKAIYDAKIKYDFKTKNKQENDGLKHSDYTNFWIAYIYFSYLQGEYISSNPGFGFYEIAEKELTGETKDWILAKILINSKKEDYLGIADQKFPSYKENTSNRQYVDKVSKFYDGIIEVNEEGPAPDFIFKDTEGKLRSLSEFQGKVVYISYWATWCKPCLMGFRKTIAMRQQMEDFGVILLNICLDEDETMWQGTMSRVPMPGINLFAGNDENLKINYDLSKLPAYYIIDKNGNFAYLPEGSRDVLEEFRKLVNE